MDCQALNGVSLSEKSKKTLINISNKIMLGKKLKKVMVGGTLLNALVSDKPIPVMFNVTTTDWVTLAQAVNSVDAITKRAVQTEIELMILSTNGKENLFWKSMYECY